MPIINMPQAAAHPVIFADINGVLNTPRMWAKEDKVDCIDAEKVRLLSAFVERVDGYVVITSSWRSHTSLAYMKALLELKGMQRNRVLDVTPSMHEKRKGDEIRSFLDDLPPCRYVILDDMAKDQFKGLDKFLVEVDFTKGLQPADIDEAEKILKRQKES